MKTFYASRPSVLTYVRSVLIVFTILLASITSNAQTQNVQINTELQKLVEKEALASSDVTDYVITAEHTSSLSNVHHVYYKQAISGIEVNGTESSIHFKDGKVLIAHNNFLKNISSEVRSGRSPGMSAKQAIEAVSRKMAYRFMSELTLLDEKNNTSQQVVFSSGGISDTDIPARLVYHYKPKYGIYLVWELSIAEVNTSDWWNFQVDATSGEIISKYNFTVSCALEHDHSNDKTEGPLNKIFEDEICDDTTSVLVDGYQVYAMPVESPNHGGRTIESDPADPTASPFGWHDTNGAAGREFDYTRGNNTYSYEDGNNAGFSPTGTVSGADISFIFPINTTYSNGDQSEPAAITNLFYWNNIIHDVTYLYGFDEAAGNFQENNYGGAPGASDSVNSEAQDGSGTCNANFGTPTDGGNPTMQMFICTPRDGDLDNGVIIHEYGHGISTRLTGGRLNSSCLNNAEQMGEGWSDYYALMLTMEIGDAATDSRGIGTWLIGEGAGGGGIRTFPYSTSMGVNSHTYDDIITEVAPHGVGSVWAEMLWEMTWDLVAQYGFDTDFYNGTGGNNISLALVTEGLKLQPCSPGFIDGRDAILAADVALYGGANECIIWEAFARRGLGFSASQGSSSSKTDGTEAFDLPPGVGTPVLNTLTTLCVTEGVQTGLGGGSPAGGTYSGVGVTDTGGTFSFDPTAPGVGMATVTYTVDDCNGTSTVVNDTIDVTDGNPVLVCQNVTVVLDGTGNATIVDADVVANLTSGTGYTIDQTGTFAPIDISTGATNLTLGDDAGASASMFSFPFFGNSFTTVYITSNGYLSFTNSGLAEFTNDVLPDANVPQNVIAAMWDDLNPTLGGTIRYKETGSAPNRVMVIEYLNVPHFGDAALTNTVQVHLFEGSGRIEIHSTDIVSDGGTRTQGIENQDGTTAFVPTGRNSADWSTANDFVAFVPNVGGLADNCGNPVTISLSQNAFTCEDIGDVIVTVTADDGNGGISTCDATVTVVGTTSTFAAGSWDVIPNSGSKALFQDSYDTATDGDVTACSCEIELGNTVTVGSGGFMQITGNILVDGILDIQHEGSIVQVNDLATVSNNGNIIVRKTTPTLGTQDFMIMGSPMTLESRTGVYGAGRLVLHHITANFVPHAGVGGSFPGTENFADNNGDNWAVHTGLLNVGEGYLVRPQPDRFTSGAFNLDYTIGTLNNGVVSVLLGYNGSRNASANMLSNPYASAIDVDLFLAANAQLDAVYYWEHITPPSNSYPGFNQFNFNMGDISAYNAGSGGVAAANGGATPTQFMASTQGFGVKALGNGNAVFNNSMRVTGPNNTLRNTDKPLVERDRIWLNITNDTYKLGSNILVAFVKGATDNFEPFYDSKRMGTPVSLYSILEDKQELSIQGRTPFNIDQEVQLGFSTMIEESQVYTISIKDIEGANILGTDVYLEDRLVKTLTNLSEESYSFNSVEGTQENRFVLIFKEKVLNTKDEALQLLSIVPNPTTGLLTITSPNAQVSMVEVLDVRGRLVATKNYSDSNSFVVDITNLDSAMYFVKIYTSEGIVTKRVLKQ